MVKWLIRVLAQRPKTSLVVSLFLTLCYWIKKYRPKYWFVWKCTGLISQLRRIVPRTFKVETIAPDYENNLDCWAAYPGKKSLAELVPESETYVPESERLCDAFFVILQVIMENFEMPKQQRVLLLVSKQETGCCQPKPVSSIVLVVSMRPIIGKRILTLLL